MSQNKIRLGIIGLGVQGKKYFSSIQEKLKDKVLITAVCDKHFSSMDFANDDIIKYQNSEALIESDLIDAVLISTPHYDHTPIGCAALNKGLHVLLEKPISVHKNDCLTLIECYRNRPSAEQIFAVMFNQRTDPRYKKIKEMIDNYELGELRRMNWIITDWFRTDAYYNSGNWRATWDGEGGGVLMNQSPHQIDILWWLFGIPNLVWGQCRFGQWHDIEVEDDVTALLNYENGATCTFITSTGEFPGTNRLEIVGEKGKIVAEDNYLFFHENEIEMSVYKKTSKEKFGKPSFKISKTEFQTKGGQHDEIIENFCDAIMNNVPLIAGGIEGIYSVEISNAILLSTFLNQAVSFPIDGDQFKSQLDKKISENRK